MQDSDKTQQMKDAIAQAKQQAMRDAIQKAKQDPFNQYMQSFNLQARNPATIPGNIAYGAGELLKHGANAGLQVANMVGLNPKNKQISDSALGLDKMIPPETANTPTAEASRFLGGIGPLVALTGGAGAAEDLAATGAKALNPVMQYLKNVAGGVASAPLFSDDSIGKSMKDALKSPANLILSALGPAMQGASSAKNAILSLGGKNTPEQVQKALQASGDSTVPAGEIISSPFLKRAQSLLSVTPLSGMTQIYEKIGQDMRDSLGGTLKSLWGGKSKSEAPIGDEVNQAVQDLYSDNKQKSGTLYQDVADTARNSNTKVIPNSTVNYAKQKLAILDRKLDEHPSSDVDKNLYGILSDIASGRQSKILDKSGKPIQTIGPKSFDDVNALRSSYWNEADKALTKGDKFTANVYKGLWSNLTADIGESAKNSGDANLYKKWTDANQYYKDHVAPFQQNKTLYKYAIGKGDPDTIIPKFLQSGNNERPALLQDLTSKLTPRQVQRMTADHITKGQREISGETDMKPMDVLNRYNQLGDRTKQILFRNNTDAKDTLDSLLNKKKLFGDNIDQMFIPRTGYTEVAQKAVNAAKNIGIGALGGVGLIHGYTPEQAMALLGSTGLGLATGRAATKALSSKKLIDAYVNAQLSKGINKMPSNNILSYQAYQALQNQGRNQ